MEIQVSGYKRRFDEYRSSSPAYSRRERSHQSSGQDEAQPSKRITPARSNEFLTTGQSSGVDGIPPKHFAKDGCLVLVGGRGTGKSTLGVIASISLGKRYICAEQYFQKQAGLSMSAARSSWGDIAYSVRETEIFSTLLSTHSRGCVIVWPSGCAQASEGLLKKFSLHHPVVYITRNPNNVHAYLERWVKEKPGRNILPPVANFRKCSNFEFYNLSGTDSSVLSNRNIHSQEPKSQGCPGSQFLKLKQLEVEFLRFLKAILDENTDMPSHNDYQSLPLISRSTYTYALSVSLSQMAPNLDLTEIVRCGSDAFELVIEWDEILDQGRNLSSAALDSVSQRVSSLRRSFPGPIIYHVIPSVSDLNTSVGEKSYFALLLHGLRLCPEYMTINLDWPNSLIKRIINARGSTKIIGHYHELQPGADGWSSPRRLELYHKAQLLGCNMIRLTQTCTSMDDNLSLQAYIHRVKTSVRPYIDLIAYNTGPLGRFSCIVNQILTPITTPYLLTSSQNTSNHHTFPQITLPDAQGAIFSSFIFNPMRYYILGADVSYSLSPAMHNAAYKHFGMPHSFGIKNVTSLDDVAQLIKDPNFGGASLAQGPRVSVMPLLHSMSRHAQAIGAVNTIIPIRSLWNPSESPPITFWQQRNRAGAVKGCYGENTDWIGIRESVLPKLSPINAIKPTSSALVIGAGGMARGAVYALSRLGFQHIFICNRTVENAHKLATHFNKLDEDEDEDEENVTNPGNIKPQLPRRNRVKVIESFAEPWPKDYAFPTVIVCCVPQSGNAGSKIQLPSEWIKNPTGGVVVDLAYWPTFLTPLLKQIRAESHRGWTTSDGLDHLAEQGAAQFELLTGRKVPTDLMRIEILRNFKINNNQVDEEALKSIDARLHRLQRQGEQLEEYF